MNADLMRELASERTRVSNELLLQRIEARVAPEDFAALRRVILEGSPVDIAPGACGPCLRVEVTSDTGFELGFDHDATLRDQVVTGVVEGSAAQGAGLRDGQTLAGRISITQGRKDVPVELELGVMSAEVSVTAGRVRVRSRRGADPGSARSVPEAPTAPSGSAVHAAERSAAPRVQALDPIPAWRAHSSPSPVLATIPRMLSAWLAALASLPAAGAGLELPASERYSFVVVDHKDCLMCCGT